MKRYRIEERSLRLNLTPTIFIDSSNIRSKGFRFADRVIE